jgi:hypothetical protein
MIQIPFSERLPDLDVMADDPAEGDGPPYRGLTAAQGTDSRPRGLVMAALRAAGTPRYRPAR